MYTIKLDINDSIYYKVMFFLNNIPVKNLEVKKVSDIQAQEKNDIISFFQSSPLKGNILLEREDEIYNEKVVF